MVRAGRSAGNRRSTDPEPLLPALPEVGRVPVQLEVEGPGQDFLRVVDLGDHGALAPEFVRRVAEGVLRGLAAAHGQSIIHRDMKPGNVLIGSDGTPKVTDFGIAGFLHEAREHARIIMGTPGYLAPEAYRSGSFDARTDLFAVGVLLAECLLGEDVFPGRNTAQIIARTQAREVVLPETVREAMPTELEHLLRALLAKAPDARPASAEEALGILGVELETSGLVPTVGAGRVEASGIRSRNDSDRDVATARIDLGAEGN